jgi:hypothetical protein
LIDKEQSLVGSTLTPEDIILDGTVSVSLNNADLVFSTEPAAVTLVGSCTITDLSSATVDMGDTVNLTYSYSEALPSGITDYITSIDFTNVGVDVTYTNTLPAGNDIALTGTSTFFGISDTKTLTAGTTDGTADMTTAVIIDPSTNSTVDFSADIGLPGATVAHPSYVTVNNIVLGQTYTIAANMSLVTDWSQVVLKDSDPQSGTIDTGIDVQSIFSKFSENLADSSVIDNINLTELPVYFYAEIPSLSGSSLNLNGTIKLSAGTDELYIVGNSSGPTAINSASPPPLVEGADGAVTLDISDSAVPFTGYVDAKSLVNADAGGTRPSGNINVAYSIAVGGGTTISSAAVSENAAIKVDAYIVVPLSLEVMNSSSIDVLDFADVDTTQDLFRRDEVTDTSDIGKYIDAIKTFTANFAITNDVFKYDDPANVVSVTFDPHITGIDPQTILSTGKSTISMNSDDILSILQTYPFTPSVTMTIPAGTISVPRDADFSFNGTVSITTDGTVTLFGEDN